MVNIETLLPSERPRERCLNHNPACLSLRECLAVVLNSGPPRIGCLGLASRILDRLGFSGSEADLERAFFTSLENSAENSSLSFLQNIPGLGSAGKARILAAFELGRRYALFRQETYLQSKNGKALKSIEALIWAALNTIPASYRQSPKEWLAFTPIYTNMRVGDFCVVERGVRTHVNVDPKELFAAILSVRSVGFFLFHNHPSGNLTPSQTDLDLTVRMSQVSNDLGIRFLGHAVVTAESQQWIEPEYQSD